MNAKLLSTWVSSILLLVSIKAEDINVEASFEPSKISTADKTVYKVRISGTQKNPIGKIPNVDGLEISKEPQLFRSASFIDGISSVRVELSFQVKPQVIGTFQIPSWQISVDDKSFSVPPAKLQVLSPGESERRVKEDLKDVAFLEIQLPRFSFYKDETILSELTLFIWDGLPVTRIENVPSKIGDSFSINKLGKWVEEKRNVSKNGKLYSTFTWPVSLKPARTGVIDIGFKVNLGVRVNSRTNSPFSNDPFFGFGREESLTVTMPPFKIIIKPAGFLKKDFKSDPTQANVQFELAQKIDAGLGDKADTEKAADLYYLAAIQGHADAAEFLAALYEEGRGVKKDTFLSSEWRSLAKKNRSSQILPADAYPSFDRNILPEKLELPPAKNVGDKKINASSSNIVNRSPMQIVDPTKQSDLQSLKANLSPSKNKDKKADEFYKLGIASFGGVGVSLNYDDAFENFKKAAHLGHPEAQDQIGVMYINAWLSIVRRQNLSASVDILKKIERQMSFEEIQEAKQWVVKLNGLINSNKQTESGLKGIIGVSVLTLNNPFFSIIAENIKSEAAKHGYDVIIMDGDRNVQTQAEQVDYFLRKGVAAIVLTPCDRISTGVAIKKANEAGVPVFTCDLKCVADGAKVVSHIQSDNLQGGRLAGDAMIEALGKEGGEVLVLHFPQANSCQLRVQGFRERISAHNKTGVSGKIEVIAVLDGGGVREEGYKATEDTLQAYPDLVGIFAINDPSALGARAALEKKGMEEQVKIIGFDGLLGGRRAIEEEKIFADPIQFPDKMGKKTVELIMSFLKGEDVPAEVLIPTQLLLKEGLRRLPSESPSKQILKSSPRFAFVTNGVDPFWDLCAAGVKIAEEEFGIECDVLMPPKGVTDQKRILETLLAKRIDGIAVSPIDSENQTSFLNEVAKNTILITQDADAPGSDRLLFLGANNYKAGRALGKLVKDAIPEGGEVMLFVGRLEQLNARQRRQGVIDELLGRPVRKLAKIKFDPVTSRNLKAEGSKYVILDTITDNFDKSKAKSNAEEAMYRYENLKCMVGLFAYNSPSCIDALKDTEKMGQIKICGFDEQDALLQAIADGYAHGTISQLPWEYGYESIKLLKDLYEGNKPSTEYVEKSFAAITQQNVHEFWRTKKEMRLIGTSSLPVNSSRYGSKNRHFSKSVRKNPTLPIEPKISKDLLKAVDGWNSIPQSVFPLSKVEIYKTVQFIVKNASGETIASTTMQPGQQVVALGLVGKELILSPSKNGKMRGKISIDHTDFKEGVAYLFELRKKQRSEYEKKRSDIAKKQELLSKNTPKDQYIDQALFQDIPVPGDFGHGKFCICEDCREKRLASVARDSSKSMSSNLDLFPKLEPAELIEIIQENQVDLKFKFEAKNKFIPDFTAKKEVESKTILMVDGSFAYTIVHCEDTPFRIWPEPFSLVNVFGEISSAKLSDKILLKEFAWMDDPRILIIPLYIDPQVLRDNGLKLFTTPASHSVPIENAMSVDLYELSSRNSSWRLFPGNKGLLKNISAQHKFHEMRPREYVFNQRGDVLGITLNNDYLFWMKNLGSRLRAGSRTLLGGNFEEEKTNFHLQRGIEIYKRLDDVLKN